MKPVLGILLACLATSALSQSLTKSQEGRKEVGQCYSACIERYTNAATGTSRALADWFTYIFSDQYASLGPDEQEAAYTAYQSLFCGSVGLVVDDMRSCRDGCLDVEVAYGHRTSRARNRFNRLFDEEIAAAGRLELCEDWDVAGEAEGPRPQRESVKAPPRRRTGS